MSKNGWLPLRTVEELGPDLTSDACVRLRSARVVVADYAQLQRDFPCLREPSLRARHPSLRRTSARARAAAVRELIDAWLVRHAGIISVGQAAQTVVNAPIDAFPERVPVVRPPRYMRAVVVSLPESHASLPAERRPSAPEPRGMLDLKGAGVMPGVVPERSFKGGGLAVEGLYPLGAALGEYVSGRLLGELFRHAKAPFEVLPAYAVLDLGFDDFHGRPAGMLVRRAHRRHPGGIDFYHPAGSEAHRMGVLFEMLLRSYGLAMAHVPAGNALDCRDGKAEWMFEGTSVPGLYSTEQKLRFRDLVAPGVEVVVFQRINAQSTAPVRDEAPMTQILDLESLCAPASFPSPVTMMVGNRPLHWGGAIAPDDPAFVRPISGLRVSPEQWGIATGNEAALRAFSARPDDECTRQTLRGFELARDLRSGALTPARVARELESLVTRTTRRWRPGAPSMRAAHRAADTFLASAATTGTELLELEADVEYASLMEAAESLVCLHDLGDKKLLARARTPILQHRLRWAARRLMASRGMQEAEATIRADLTRVDAELFGGDPLRGARRLIARAKARPRDAALRRAALGARALLSGARLRRPERLSGEAFAACVRDLLAAAPVNACVASWTARLRAAVEPADP